MGGKARFSSDLRFLAEQRSSGSSRSSFSLSLAPAAGTAHSFEAMSTKVPKMPSPTLSPYIEALLPKFDTVSDSDSDVQLISAPDTNPKKRKSSPEVIRDTKKRKAVNKSIEGSYPKRKPVNKAIHRSHSDSDDDRSTVTSDSDDDWSTVTSDSDDDRSTVTSDSDDDRSTVTPNTGSSHPVVTGLTSLNEPEIKAWDKVLRNQFRLELQRILDANMLTKIVDEKLKSSNLDGADTEEDSDDSEDVVRPSRKQSRRKVLPDDNEDEDDDDSTVTPQSPLLRPVDSPNSQHSDDEVENQQGLEDDPEKFPFELTVKAASEDYTIYLPGQPQQQSVVRVYDTAGRPRDHYKIDIDPELTERCYGGLFNMTAYGRCLEDPSKSSRNYECPDGSAQIDHVNRRALQAMSLLNDYKFHVGDNVSDKDKAILRSVVELLKQTDMVKPFSDNACFSKRFEFDFIINASLKSNATFLIRILCKYRFNYLCSFNHI